MLPNDRIKFLDLHLFGHVLLILGSGVEMTGTRAGHQFDFISHGLTPDSDLVATLADIRKHRVNASLVYGT
jgi:hypothetical protein